MACPKCSHDNPAGSRFCLECGAALASRCADCRAELPVGAKFCNTCGAAVARTAPLAYTPRHLADRILTSKGALEGERKQVTVLFCDIVESTRLAERLDPETMHELMDRILRLMAEAVHRYEGTVNQFLGDGVMALFGAPLAVEDHALRGVQAALTIQETIAGLSEEERIRHGLEIRVRAGLNTGLVVVGRIGDDLRMDYTAVGETTNLAARLQSRADPGTILVGEATHRLVDGHVRSEFLGRTEIKGFSEPVSVHRIVGRRRRTRLEIREERGFSPLVGRERELALLRETFERAREGRGQVVGVVADPGAGKSRLIHEFRRSLVNERVAYLMGACFAYAQSTPYGPVLEILRSNFEIEEGDNTLQIDQKLRRGALSLDRSLEMTLPFLRELLAMQPEESLKTLEAGAKRQRTFEAIRALIVVATQRAPMVLVVEDLHWIDQTSEDYLMFLIDSFAALRVLLITTQRPGHRVRWSDKTYYRQIALDDLSGDQTAVLIRSLLHGEPVPDELIRRVHERAEGNPFFVEEIIRSMLERGGAMEGPLDFPETAQDVVRARLDRLPEPVKRTAQVAAVIGREFSERLLAEVVDTPSRLSDDLEVLKRGEFIRETRFFPEPEYIFKHAIVQDVAYESILARRRHQLHREIGRAIEYVYTDRLIEHFAVLAHHFVHGNDRRKSVEYLVRAGDKAVEAAAGSEAMTLYRRALDFVEADDSRGRADILAKMMPIAYFQLQDGEHSLRLAAEALATYERLGDRQNIVAIHLHVQTMYLLGYGDGAESRAMDNLLAIERLTEDEPDTVQKGQMYQRIAHLYLHRAVPVKSLEWAGRAVALYERLGSPLGTCLGTALTLTGRVREGIAYNMRNWEPLLASGNVPIISIVAHELTHTLALLRDVPSVLQIGEQALLAIAGAPWMSAMVRRPLLLAYLLSGDTRRAAENAEAIARVEPQTYLG